MLQIDSQNLPCLPYLIFRQGKQGRFSSLMLWIWTKKIIDSFCLKNMCVAGRWSWLQVIFYFFWKVHTKKLKLDLWISQAYSREKLKYFCKLDLSYVAFESDKLLGDQSVRNKEFHGIYGWTQDFVLGELQICIVSCGLRPIGI